MINDLFTNIHEAIRSPLASILPEWLVDIAMIVISISFLVISSTGRRDEPCISGAAYRGLDAGSIGAK